MPEQKFNPFQGPGAVPGVSARFASTAPDPLARSLDSSSRTIYGALKRKQNLDDARAVADAQSNGIEAMGEFLRGLQTEDPAVSRQTLDARFDALQEGIINSAPEGSRGVVERQLGPWMARNKEQAESVIQQRSIRLAESRLLDIDQTMRDQGSSMDSHDLVQMMTAGVNLVGALREEDPILAKEYERRLRSTAASVQFEINKRDEGEALWQELQGMGPLQALDALEKYERGAMDGSSEDTRVRRAAAQYAGQRLQAQVERQRLIDAQRAQYDGQMISNFILETQRAREQGVPGPDFESMLAKVRGKNDPTTLRSIITLAEISRSEAEQRDRLDKARIHDQTLLSLNEADAQAQLNGTAPDLAPWREAALSGNISMAEYTSRLGSFVTDALKDDVNTIRLAASRGDVSDMELIDLAKTNKTVRDNLPGLLSAAHGADQRGVDTLGYSRKNVTEFLGRVDRGEQTAGDSALAQQLVNAQLHSAELPRFSVDSPEAIGVAVGVAQRTHVMPEGLKTYFRGALEGTREQAQQKLDVYNKLKEDPILSRDIPKHIIADMELVEHELSTGDETSWKAGQVARRSPDSLGKREFAKKAVGDTETTDALLTEVLDEGNDYWSRLFAAPEHNSLIPPENRADLSNFFTRYVVPLLPEEKTLSDPTAFRADFDKFYEEELSRLGEVSGAQKAAAKTALNRIAKTWGYSKIGPRVEDGEGELFGSSPNTITRYPFEGLMERVWPNAHMDASEVVARIAADSGVLNNTDLADGGVEDTVRSRLRDGSMYLEATGPGGEKGPSYRLMRRESDGHITPVLVLYDPADDIDLLRRTVPSPYQRFTNWLPETVKEGVRDVGLGSLLGAPEPGTERSSTPGGPSVTIPMPPAAEIP